MTRKPSLLETELRQTRPFGTRVEEGVVALFRTADVVRRVLGAVLADQGITEFAVNDQRSTLDLAEALVFPARELIPTDDVRARAAGLVATEPWGREQWERLAEGTLFDGMESWLPWLVDGDELLTDVLPDSAKVVLVEPRRMRDRAGDLLAEEADLARAVGPRPDAGMARARTAGSGAGAQWRHPRDFTKAAYHARIAIRDWRGVAGAGGTLHVLRRRDCFHRFCAAIRETGSF